MIKKKIRFLLLEIITLVFLVMLSAILLNPSIAKGDSTKPNTPDPAGSSILSGSSADTPSSGLSSDPTSSQAPPAVLDYNDWRLILVNESNPLEAAYINSIKTRALKNGLEVNEQIFDPLMEMLDAASGLGYHLIVCSAYRDYDKQVALFEDRIARYQSDGMSYEQAYHEAKTSVALPGTSEHHTGLAVDIVSERYQNLDDGMFDLEEIKWLYSNCHKYGFIVRYPEGKSDITGIIHEPWHYRYVGIEAATEIMEREISLEEYLGMA